MGKETVSLTDIAPTTFAKARTHLEDGETIDELVESLLSRYVESDGNIEVAAEREKVGRAVARAFRERERM